jgi:hypothetical protein
VQILCWHEKETGANRGENGFSKIVTRSRSVENPKKMPTTYFTEYYCIQIQELVPPCIVTGNYNYDDLRHFEIPSQKRKEL